MDACRICSTPLEEGLIAVRDGRLRWVPVADPDDLAPPGTISASRCPRCRIGVFDDEIGVLDRVDAPTTSRVV
jgi:hypothetical protein